MSHKEIKIEEFEPNEAFFNDLKNGKFVLVLGAGFSLGIKNNTKEFLLPKEMNISYEIHKNIPLSKDFYELTNLIFKEEVDVTKYQAAANLWENCNFIINKTNLSSFYRNLFIPDKKEFLQSKLSLYRNILIPSWHGIYTFNFDTVFETIVELEKKETQYYSAWFSKHKGILPKKRETFIAHLHGIITNENLKDLVFSTSGYDKLRRELHTLYDTLHNDANENLKLFIIGTQFDEEPIDDKFFESLNEDVTIYHFDRSHNNFRTKPKIINNRNYHPIVIKEPSDVLNFLQNHQSEIESETIKLYLKKIISNEVNSKIDELYVRLFGQEEIHILKTDAIGIELLGADFSTTYHNYLYSKNKNDDDLYAGVDKYIDKEISAESDEKLGEPEIDKEKIRQPKIDSILNIEQDTQRFIIVGAPGSGKTTTLKKILFQNANKILNEGSEIKIPIFITSNEYKNDKSFKKIISEKLNIEDCESFLQIGNLQLLVDGINEIDQNQKKYAYQELKRLINDYPNIAIILTTRKIGFTNDFNIPVFELKELQESEIKEFIQKINPENQESIWSQLEENKKLLEFAYNPLYLSMIVIASMKGTIPTNRGSLFEFFVKSLLEREKIVKIEMDSIVDILSELAFNLKKEGMVSIPKERSEKIITDRIKNTHGKYSPLELLAKVNECNLLSITSNTSFIHEAFLDYFCSVKLKRNFNELFNTEILKIVDIGIKDVTATFWYEPLIMCGDLFRESAEEKQAHDFFNLLFRGILQKDRIIKKIEELEKDDWNQNLHIACKIAFNLKTVFPKIYTKAEQYMSNYMILWLGRYKENKEIIPLENLFAAISSLSSIKLLEKIFFDLNWQNVWLYSPSDDSENEIINKYVIENSQTLSFSIINSISDFNALFKVLSDEEKLNSIFFTKIKYRINQVEQLLLRNTSIKNLKITYLKKIKDIDLLKFISYVDPDFFIENYQKDWGIDEYANQLLELCRYEKAREELIRIIDLLEIPKRDNIIESMIRLKYLNTISDYLETKITEGGLNNDIFNRIKVELKSIPYNSISKKLKSYFFIDDINIIQFQSDYKILKILNLQNIIRVEIKNISNINVLEKDLQINIDNTYIGIVKSVQASMLAFPATNYVSFTYVNLRYYKDKKIKIGLTIQLINNNLTPLTTGLIFEDKEDIPFPFTAEYNSHTLLSTDKVTVEISNYSNIERLFNKKLLLNINNQAKGYVISKKILPEDIINIFQYVKNTDIEIVDNKVDSEKYKIGLDIKVSEEINLGSIKKTGKLKSFLALSILEIIHPERLENDSNLVNTIFQELNINSKIISLIFELGFSYIFHKKIPNVNYGIVLSIYNLTVRVYSLLNKSIIEYTVLTIEIDKYRINQIVVIEINEKLGVISQEDERNTKIGYILDEIIRIDIVKKEGHIRKRNKKDSEEKDYYFHFNDCDFNPILGDIVSFLPAINIYPNSFGLPKAYNIYKVIGLRKCIISKLNYDGIKNEFYGSATDVESSEEMDFICYKSIWAKKNHLKTGNMFTYKSILPSTDEKKQFIILIEKIK